ncbi:hypothetical protein EJ06DRAFT_234625 [Trichodelitschia bisporula]|uniref:Bud neck involved protein n=1 Tax=Trichodelitschia bisporula TaxID=703511 RepID=A0A6G1HJT6_9PEZI|nr:hypothetical protein EJ06DRAFT_234625 [Trichodelitschia bisporula]
MAEVLVSTSTITMLHAPSDAFQNASSSAQTHHPQSRTSSSGAGQMARNQMYTSHSVVGSGYRGASAPVAPYAFQSTPVLKQEIRTVSNPVQRPSIGISQLNSSRHQYAPSSSASTASSNSSSNPSLAGNPPASKDDSVLSSRVPVLSDQRPYSLFSSASSPDLSLTLPTETAKPSPDRYRRVRRTDSTNSTSTLDSTAPRANSSPSVVTLKSGIRNVSEGLTHNLSGSADDSIISRSQAGRYRRRSFGAFEVGPVSAPAATPVAATATKSPPTWAQIAAIRPEQSRSESPTQVRVPYHERTNSGESTRSSHSAKRPTSARQDSYSSNTTNTPPRPTTAPVSASRPSMASRSTQEQPKRTTIPSPLSKPMDTDVEKAPASPKITADAFPPSPAAQKLAAITEKDGNTVKSRLRRAFSFGSAQELRRSTAENGLHAERMRLRKEKFESERNEDSTIAASQEAGGIGTNIYTGQGGVYGSTDNLSISSTASSASIMLRKMGKGMKRSSRSLKALFRPKLTSVSDKDRAQPPSAAEVSLVTVEAERDTVNVNADPHEHPGGGTGFPRLERNSLDANTVVTIPERGSSSHGSKESSRKSIVGGDRERAEVLAAVKKGILKRRPSPSFSDQAPAKRTTGSGSSSPTPTPGAHAPESVTTDWSSVPATPEDRVAAEGTEKDFFLAAGRYATTSTRSLPNSTPQPGGGRNISWNPRIQFYDVWASSEYDRRGDIATCNRLTPMLAQQIKEELNSFKMEMEVHEDSKPHTHFF